MLQVVPSADVNWLLSTEVQSGAALVAIVGGLLVARLAGLSGERTFLRRAIRDASAELIHARENREQAEAELDQLNADAFFRFASSRLLAKSGVVGGQELSALVHEFDRPLGDRAATEIVEPWIAQMRLAFELANEYLAGRPLRQIVPADVRTAVSAGIPGIDNALVDDVVDELNSRGELGENAHRQYTFTRIARYGSPEVAAADRQTRARRLDEARGRADQCRYSIRAAEARMANLEAARSQTARPEGVGRIVAALVYLAAVCVVGPLGLMAWGRTALPGWSRGLVVALFISGLTAFLLVIVGLLRDHPERDHFSSASGDSRAG